MPESPRLVYSKDYAVDIGGHVFPTSKYSLIKERLIENPPLKERVDFIAPQAPPDEAILLVHDRKYLDKLKNGRLTEHDILRLELPYSKALVDASILCCGGTIGAVEIALQDNIGIHIGGGFHHAFPDHGEGFCVLNDIAVSVRWAIKRGLIKKALIIDCDLHHGNGTAAIFASDSSVFTFSIHEENNYPFPKPKSNLDIGLEDRAGDEEYLAALRKNIPKIIDDFNPNLLLYVAGADPYKEDQIGGLALTKEGLRMRDEFIFKQALDNEVPVAVVLAGGYAFRLEDTVEIHYNTLASGIKLFYEK